MLTSNIDAHFFALYSPNVLGHAMKVFKMHKKLERLKLTNTETSVLSCEDALAVGKLRRRQWQMVVVDQTHSLRDSKWGRDAMLTRIGVWLQLTRNLDKTLTNAAALDP